ncbi:hypothetical protein ACH5RR_015168 [Cinchona calisaya]|uniref:Myosin heavy chain-like protein n=1 Tax=Cinchona calisaya TaxID=153742 RepID=A0ABD2ZT63_9GENT
MTIPFILLLVVAATYESAAAPVPAPSPVALTTTSPSKKTQVCNSLICQVQEAELKLSQLESGLEKIIQELNAKTLYVKECEKKIEEITLHIHHLNTSLASFEDDSSRANQKLSTLEEELQLLWSISRRNNFEIHTLEYRAHDAEKRIKLLTPKVEQMADIVSEQWIQIRQLEQAVQMTQVRALKVRQLKNERCPFVKFMKNILGEHLEMLKGILYPYVANGRSVLEKASHYLKRTFSAAKLYHHQLQGYIKQSMLRNEFTAVLANEEVVFFVASALITFPLLSICVLFSSCFS